MASRVARKFLAQPGARWGLAGAGLVALAALVSPVLVNDGPHALLRRSPDAIALSERLSPPSARHWFGTDDLGRDVFARLLAAAPLSLAIGLSASITAMGLGLLVGGVAGAAGGAADVLLSRVTEVFLCFPALFLLLALVAFLPPSPATVVAAIAVASWPDEARYARAEIRKARAMDFTLAARAAGLPPARIFLRHLLPSALPPVLVCATFGVAEAILAAAALSFLGVGLSPATPTWGGTLAVAEAYVEHAWWLALFPGLAIFATVASYNLLGEAWRAALDPTRRLPFPRSPEAR
jgi:peptide/nickel transport system permease protein